jgi:predicted ATPase/class 3 adenylate cyclase
METPASASFAALLKRHRLAAGLSQEELAARAGMSPRGVSDLERGKRTQPHLSTVRSLADALDLSETDRAAFLAAARENTPQPPTPAPLEPPFPAGVPAESLSHPSPRPPTGTVTFLFTDIEGSTRLLQQLGASRYADALDRHRRLLRTTFLAHGGYEVDTQGDAFFVAFPTAPDALAAAAEATQTLAAASWPADTLLRVRMGLHAGAPQVVGDRYIGLDVHRAARIAAAGHGGQILLSASAAELARHDLPDGVAFRDVGIHRLKDLQQPERIYQLLGPDLPAEFPPLKTLDARPHNLPVQPTPLLGREEEIARLCALLRRGDVRLVTLTGPGGVGKTRLGLQVAAELVDDFADGVYYVRLSRLSDPQLVVPIIAQALGLRETASRPIDEVLRDYVRRRSLLLLLDNFEHVSQAASDLAVLLEVSPGLRALVTSRGALHLRGEKEAPVAPLALPKDSSSGRHGVAMEELTRSPAVALFLQHAQDVRPDFALTPANAAPVAAICVRLDGLPLAIELAAARIKLLPPPALLKRLERSLPLLTGGARDLDERQQTMRNTLAWSYDLLAPEEQRLLRRLAVFAGGWMLEAAEDVCAAPAGAEPLGMDVLEGLGRLVDHSLVQQREEGAEARFGMLHVIREFAHEQLEASGEAEALRKAHAVYVLALAERTAPELIGPEQGRWLTRLEREHDNVRATLGWAHAHREAEIGQRLVSSVARFWAARGYMREGQAWVEQMLALDSGMAPVLEARAGRLNRMAGRTRSRIATRARAHFAGGWLASWQENVAAAEVWLNQAATLGREAGDLYTTAYAVDTLGNIAASQGDLELAVVRCAEGLALMREVGDQRGMAVALINLGCHKYFGGDLEQATAYLTESLGRLRELRDSVGIACCLGYLGQIARRRGSFAEAETLTREALALNRERQDPYRSAEFLGLLVNVVAAKGEGEHAARWLGAADVVREELGTPRSRWEQSDMEEAVAEALVGLGEEAWQATYTIGRALSLEEAIAEALGEDGKADERATE